MHRHSSRVNRYPSHLEWVRWVGAHAQNDLQPSRTALYTSVVYTPTTRVSSLKVPFHTSPLAKASEP